ncbi:unnamed protein product [Oikopleura dioica]|uniref:Metalloendopeptidase n=1 Tax=Oikopleura dioica TaxID=34765 RepID=E4X1G6_OIKDI|nr:unnamed protein product [Oikopleura dioica]CBY37720.1 unnamed protein product [Oikopleura dioica]
MRADIKKWQFKKDKEGAWIVPIWQDDSFVENILTPLNTWERIDWINQELNKCVKFVEIERRHRRRYSHRLRLVGNQKLPCFSYIGAQQEGDQDIGWVEKCSSGGHIGGYLMTALGFTYEHTRPDRDDYVNIDWSTVGVGRDYAFLKLPVHLNEDLELPYDYRSVLHFGSKHLGQVERDGTRKNVMTKKDGSEIVPNRLRLTSLDAAKICKAYGCDDACGNRWTACKNGEPIFAHRHCDGYVDCEDGSDEEGCSDTVFTSCCTRFSVDLAKSDTNVVFQHFGMYNGRMAYHSNHPHGKYLYFRQGKWAIGETLGGQLAWYWTDDAEIDQASLFASLGNNRDVDDQMFDEPCPDGLEFRSTVNVRVFFVLDNCVDGSDSSPPAGQPEAGSPFEAPHKPAATKIPGQVGGHIKPDSVHAPQGPTAAAPTQRPTDVPALQTCNINDQAKVMGGLWNCNGRKDHENSKGKNVHWFAGTTCEIDCKVNNRVGICGPDDKYPMYDKNTQPGTIRCLSTGKWDYFPTCKCQKNECLAPKTLFTKRELNVIGSYYDCHHPDPKLNPIVSKTYLRKNPLGTVCEAKCPETHFLECNGMPRTTTCSINNSYRPSFDQTHQCNCIGKCGDPKDSLLIGDKVVVPCLETDQFCHLQCPSWDGKKWELRYGTNNFVKWDGWLECKCKVGQECTWNVNNQPAMDFIHCVEHATDIRRENRNSTAPSE